MDAEMGGKVTARQAARQVREDGGGDGCCAFLLTFLSMFLCLITFPISIWMMVKQVQVCRITW